eukprot:TRINITY_DN27737_c0_g4_i1.p1 TRINITY_DN27737_c0_g4~~TRINITY_DN27737_c0_g4_i1.p1  ORF type:complete len:849 (+),score=118.37 TRINITY_DN27737_c0_g4_i1:301-2547(+)
MSTWFAMHAYVSSSCYKARLLNTLVRLPVPSWSQVESARTYGSSYEKVNSRQMFRVPFAMGTQESVLNNESLPQTSMASDAIPPLGEPQVESADLWGLEGRGDEIYELDGNVRTVPDQMNHIQLVQEAMQYWQAYDGFARVAMSMGTNQLVTALSYYVIANVLISNKAVIAGCLVMLTFMVVATALIRLDMSLTGNEFRTAVFLVFGGPVLSTLAAQQWVLHSHRGYAFANHVYPLVYAFHSAWLTFLLYLCKVRQSRGGAWLPTGFRSVMYIDIFGWIKRERPEDSALAQKQAMQADELPRGPLSAPWLPATSTATETKVSGIGPATQCVQFQGSTPVAARPEHVIGASKGTPAALISKAIFDPTTFVPREMEQTQASEVFDRVRRMDPHQRAGLVPWKIFCSATSLLMILWWASGLAMLAQASGMCELRVPPLKPEKEESLESLLQIGKAFHSEALTGGQAILTQWPHGLGSRPHRLACGMDLKGQITLLASSKFALFSASLEKAMKGGLKSSKKQTMTASFQYAPPCDSLEGEMLQDVSMICNGRDGACTATALKERGRRLTSCGLTTSQAIAEGKEEDLTIAVSDSFLGSHLEEVTSFALSGRCSGSTESQCAYARTNHGRLVEFRRESNQTNKKLQWIAHRSFGHGFRSAEGGALHMIGNKYLGVLTEDGTELLALDPEKDGEIIGSWTLPNEDRWMSMCSASGSLYFLGDTDEGPRLWRFPLPAKLQPLAREKPTATEKPEF